MTQTLMTQVTSDPDLTKAWTDGESTWTWDGSTSTNCYGTYSWWPTYTQSNEQRAFAVAKALVLKKIVKATSVTQFIELVDTIAKAL